MAKFGWKKPEQKIVRPDTIGVPYNPHTFMVEALLIQNDMDKPSTLKNNVLYYIAGHLVRSLLPVQCQDSHTFRSTMPSFARFAAHKQKGGLILLSAFAFKIVKMTECIFHRRVLEQGIGITKDTKLFCKIQCAVIEQFGPHIVRCPASHFVQHAVLAEVDHRSTIIRTVSKYLELRMATYAKRYSEMIVHKNILPAGISSQRKSCLGTCKKNGNSNFLYILAFKQTHTINMSWAHYTQV